MNRKANIFQLVQRMGIVRPRDIEAASIPREYLLRLYRNGELERVGRGLYTLPAGLTSGSDHVLQDSLS